MDNKQVSVKTIGETVDYLADEFLSPLKSRGESILGIIDNINNSALQSNQTADSLIAIRDKIQNYVDKLEAIINQSRVQLQVSSETIGQNQSEVTSTLDNLV